MLVAPTEPEPLKKAASKITLLPETYGVDIFFVGNGRKFGVQRKEVKDLLASVNDGRLQKEILQMGALDYKVFLLEGKLEWSTDGFLLNKTFGQQWNKASFNGLIWSIQDRCDLFLHTEGIYDTVETVRQLEVWAKKSRHESLSRRPGMATGIFGSENGTKEAAAWILQSVPGVGVRLAERIVGMYGLPLKLTIGLDELLKVEGIGEKKAERIIDTFTQLKTLEKEKMG